MDSDETRREEITQLLNEIDAPGDRSDAIVDKLAECLDGLIATANRVMEDLTNG